MLCLIGALSAFAQSAPAQQPTQKEDSPPSTQNIDELKQKLAELEKEVETLHKSVSQLEEQQKTASKLLEEQQKSASKQEPKPQSTAPGGDAVPQSNASSKRPITQVAKQETVNRDRETVARINNQPLHPELVGFFKIPGAKAKLKIDGYAKLDVIMDPRPVGDPDQFITTTIPVNLTPAQKVVNSNVIFRESRINLDFRSPFKEQEFRFYAEIDFYGPDGPTDPRLRHLYGQVNNALAGHTWTTFTDPDVIPDTLDFQSPAGIIKTRQAQFRFTQPFGKHHSIAIAVERPGVRGFALDNNGDLIRSSVVRGLLRRSEEGDLRLIDLKVLNLSPNDGPYNPAPDFVARYRYERERGHLQFGSLFRVLGFQSKILDTKAFGWGLNFSSGVMLGKRDNFLLSATYGEGIARYFSNLSILDLDFDLENDGRPIKALPAIGAMGAYQHYWNNRLRSTVTFGYDRVQNTALQPADIFSKSYYTSGNLILRPLKHYRFTVGAEFIYGWQALKDNSVGRANRVQVSLQYNLYRKPGDPDQQ
jgi:hypothetical protein